VGEPAGVAVPVPQVLQAAEEVEPASGLNVPAAQATQAEPG
jgi:hypothetical protein